MLSHLLSVEDMLLGARFFWTLPSLLRHRISLEEAQTTLRRRLEHREADFLTLAKRVIYENPGSPYRQLLTLAGCEYGDLERLVRQDGVEGALRTLLRQGVYLTVDEFKGRRAVVRGSATMAVDPGRLRNPWSGLHVPAQSSGSRSARTAVLLDLVFVRDCAVSTLLALNARGGTLWLKATWENPGGGAMFRLLKLAGFGDPPVRWFSMVDPGAAGLHPRYRWNARLMRWESVLLGVPLPSRQYVSLDNPLPIAHWMAQVLRAGRTPFLYAFTSSAVRLCQAAVRAGIDLDGAQFTLIGEPVTAARLAVIHQAGAEATTRYGTIESGPIGYGCLAPDAPDDVHLLHDLHALIQPEPDRTGVGAPPLSLFISTLRQTAPVIMLNVSMGDQAVMTRRACGCRLKQVGWATHLHTIRSFEKLTAGGMTFLDTDVIRVLEEVLPSRFGGAPTDYQLVEEEAEDGQPRVRLLVHPRVGPVAPEMVAEIFLSSISAGSGAEKIMGLVWRDAKLLRVERRAPLATASGKILHLHVARRAPRDPCER